MRKIIVIIGFLFLLFSCSSKEDYEIIISDLEYKISKIDYNTNEKISELEDFSISLKDDLNSEIENNSSDIYTLEKRLENIENRIDTLERQLRLGF